MAGALVGVVREAGEEGEEDGRLVLDASELEACEEDILPVRTMMNQRKAKRGEEPKQKNNKVRVTRREMEDRRTRVPRLA